MPVTSTRAAILDAAERLFAAQGIKSTSNRQVSEAAGQGNNTAVGYHFGTQADLVEAILQRHSEAIEQIRVALVDELTPTDLRGWVRCLIEPTAIHLDRLGRPTTYARIIAQVATDPTLRPLTSREATTAPTLQRVLAEIDHTRPELSAEVIAERNDLMKLALLYGFASREAALAEGRPTHRRSWGAAATGLVDAVTALWLAPVTPT